MRTSSIRCLVLLSSLAASCGRIGYDATARDGAVAEIDAPLFDFDSASIGIDAGPTTATVESLKSYVGSNNHASGDFLHEIAHRDNRLYFGGSYGDTISIGTDMYTTSNPRNMLYGALNLDGSPIWVQEKGNFGFNQVFDVEVNGVGVYYSGFFENQLDLGDQVHSIGGIQASFVARFPHDGGAATWSRAWGTSGFDYARSIAVDASGRVYASGFVEGTVTFAGTPVGGAGGRDALVVALDASGNDRWVWGAGGAERDDARRIAIGPDGNLYVAGRFGGTVDFGNGPVSAKSGDDIFVLSLTPAGALRWVKDFGGTGADSPSGIAVTSDSTVVVGGLFSDTVNFEVEDRSSVGLEDIFVLGLDAATGAPKWVRSFGASGDDGISEIEIDVSGNAVIVGNVTGAVDVGGGLLPFNSGVDALVFAYDSNGDHLWSTTFGGSGESYIQGVEAITANRIYLSGRYSGQLTAGSQTSTAAGTFDLYLVELLLN